ncbi:hypothetical protein BEL04_00475 [Mucilaginibacter sp. PPCGB 2223]|uniref:hypothetical protein n=1 Tax=Mucilaginibacter sp. PPCGB 2223 TaxID=1886027 RepID=UPI0008247756|nr:hypothetical protein [Mucilaginibacter sp. PPCGB 2223]OCX52841.1 hypothetical protein BEL04_00475 [Mucilaginibacter sp. PPCGB 2223]
MKKVFIILAAAAILSSCNQRPQQNNVTIQSNTTAGFDVNKLANLVKTSTDPQVLEKAINDPANGINNLDLDKDGNIDYLKVNEPGQNQLDVIDDVSKDQSVTVASIKVNPTDNNNADLNIQGNPQYVGDNYYYHSHFTFGDFLLMSYLLRPHPYYVPMYHYGYYPSYYSRTRVSTTYRTSAPTSANRSYSRSVTGSSSQRSFGTRNSSSRVRSGGFGSGSHSSGFSSGSSRRSFGGSRSGFGRRR